MNSFREYSQKQILIFQGVMTLLEGGCPLHELKVADITECAGIGKSTAYEYFSSKDELIREALAYHLSSDILRFAHQVFSAATFQGMLRNALDHLEQSLDGNSAGILFLLLLEHRKPEGTAYLDDAFRQRLEDVVNSQIQRIMALGQAEGEIAPDMTRQEVQLVLFGLFTAYIQQLISIKHGPCGSAPQPPVTREQREEIRRLKQQTQKLLLKALN